MSTFFKKCPKTAFLTVFSKICLRRRKFSQNRGKTLLWKSSKNQFGRSKNKKKGRQNFRIFFENPPPPPRENPRSAPVYRGGDSLVDTIGGRLLSRSCIFCEKKNFLQGPILMFRTILVQRAILSVKTRRWGRASYTIKFMLM